MFQDRKYVESYLYTPRPLQDVHNIKDLVGQEEDAECWENDLVDECYNPAKVSHFLSPHQPILDTHLRNV